MMEFEPKYFRKLRFTDGEVKRFLSNALRDLEIAEENRRPEVKFNYSYTTLIKGGIALLAKKGIKIRSVPGHHAKLIEKMAEILGEEYIRDIGNAMRSKRNEDLYAGGIFISEKESVDYFNFVKKVLFRIREEIGIEQNN